MTTRTAISPSATAGRCYLAKFAIPSGPLTCAFDVKTSQAGRRVRADIWWYNAAGAGLGNTPITWVINNMVAGQIYRPVFTATPPVGATQAEFVMIVDTMTGNAVEGEQVWFDNVMAGSDPTGTYFDGSSPDCSWEGTPHASRSIQTVLYDGRKVVRAQALGTTWPAQPNQIANGTFETDTTGWGTGTAVRTNLMPNPNCETNIIGWYSNQGTQFPLTRDTTAPIGGTASAMTTRTATSPNTTVGSIYLPGTIGGSTAWMPVTPGQVLTVGVDVRCEAANRTAVFILSFRDAGGSPIAGNVSSGLITLTAGVTRRITVTGTAPAAAALCNTSIAVATVSGDAPVGERVWYDNSTIESGTTDGVYFDGSTPAVPGPVSGNMITHAWTGTANASTSTRIAATVRTRDTTQKHGGTASMRVDMPPGAANALTVLPPTFTGLTIGRAYQFEGWVYCPAASIAAKPTLRVAGVAAGGYLVDVADTWTFVSVIFTATTTSATGYFANSVATTQDVTTYYVDDVKFTEVQNLITAGVGGTFDPSGTGASTITGFTLTGAPVLSADTTRVHTGTGSMKIAWENAVANSVRVSLTGLTVGQQYTYEAWCFVPTGSQDVRVSLSGGAASTNYTTKNAWFQVSMTFTATATTHAIGLTTGSTLINGSTVFTDDWRLYKSTATTIVGVNSQPSMNNPAIPENTTVTFSTWVRTSTDLTGLIGIRMLSRDDGAAEQGVLVLDAATPEVQPTPTPNTWTRYAWRGTVKAGRTLTRIYVQPYSGDYQPPGSFMDTTEWMVEKDGALDATYFDGNSPDTADYDYRWSGTVGNSPSERGTFTPTGTLERATNDWPSRWGTASALYTSTGTMLDQYIEYEPTPVTGAYVNARAAIGTIQSQIQSRLSMRFYDSGGTLIGSAATSAWVQINTSSYATLWQSVARPASAATVRLRVEFQTPQSTALPVGAGVYIDAVMVSADPTATKPIYFDGDGIDSPGMDFAWTGTPNDSTSTRTVTAQESTLTGPVIECYDDAIFDFGIETLAGMVTVTPQAVDEDGTTVLWTGEQVTVSGNTPAVLIVPDVDWGGWRPRLLIEQGNPFTIDPRLNHPKFRTTEECADQLLRSYNDVTTIEGPTVVEKIGLACGEYIYKVEWTMMAANPMILGPTEKFAEGVWSATGGSLSPRENDFALAPGVAVGVVADPVVNEQTDCEVDDTSPLAVFDPCCPGFALPPSPPFIKDLCLDQPSAYDRTWIQIPKDYAPAIEDGLMSITITNDNHNKRGLRVRVYPDPIAVGYQQGVVNEAGVIKTTPEECDFCDEFFITYIPANAVWRLDGPNRRITTQPSGLSQQIVSSASVRGRGGGPFTFPVMSCNMGYLVIVDVPTAYAENCGADCIGYTQGSCWVDVVMRRATL